MIVMNKKLIITLLAFLLAILMVGCGKNNIPDPVKFADTTYIYEGEGYGGQFSLSIKSDGTYFYYEGLDSDYIAIGEWTVEGNKIRLADNEADGHPFVNYFKFDEGKLVFVKKNSTGFLYVDVKNGDCFKPVTFPEEATQPIVLP